MSDFTVVTAELDSAGSAVGAAGSTLGGLTLSAPDVTMYGDLVGSAASHAEPANTESILDLLSALASLGSSMADRCSTSATAYRETEQNQVDLVGRGVSAPLAGGAAAVKHGTAV